MGFLTGRVSSYRFQIERSSPEFFGPVHLEKLAEHTIGKQTEEKDGTRVGWIAGDDILDVDFDLHKNVVDDCLAFSLRIDTLKFPNDLLRAYIREELQALAENNPEAKPSAQQKKEAREAARAKLANEAQDGRFTRRKAYPLLWDGRTNQVMVGTTSGAVLGHVQALFQETFGHTLVSLDSGSLAVNWATARQRGEMLSVLKPARFMAGSAPVEVAWVSEPGCFNYLGNEFLLWLWYFLETEIDTLPLEDGSQVVVVMTRFLALECPRGISGSETIRSECPTKLPEAQRAIQAGKLPRQAGLVLVRHGQQYELTLQAETLIISAAKLPATKEKDRAELEARVGQLRHLLETVDRLYETFLKTRLGADWGEVLGKMRRWLHQEEQERLLVASQEHQEETTQRVEEKRESRRASSGMVDYLLGLLVRVPHYFAEWRGIAKP